MNITCIKSTRAISTIIYYSALIGIRIVGEKYCEGFYFVLVERKKGHLNEFLFDFWPVFRFGVVSLAGSYTKG